MQNVLIVGGGKGGKAILKILSESTRFHVSAIVDINPDAAGIRLAKEMGVKTGEDWRSYARSNVGIIIEVTSNEHVFREIVAECPKKTVVPGSVAYLIAKLLEEKEALIRKLENETKKHELILQSTAEGMTVIDKGGNIIFMNRSAEKINGVSACSVVGRPISCVIPNSRLEHVLRTKKSESNVEIELQNGTKILASHIPMFNEDGEVAGAISVFRDITEAVKQAEEITNLKEIKMMLQEIIHSSDDAISVVDEKGRGILINPAYTRITGLSEEEVIGKPATADISEGESMHYKVLQTKKPVRGVKMRVGPLKKEVVVNVAPVIVNGALKGSVGVIHDVSEIESLTKELSRARQMARVSTAKYTFDDIIHASDEMDMAVEQAKLAAQTPVTILLRGESGTGKELFAHAIHQASSRRNHKFIRVNCASISESLLESELFGYEEGAFSGAKRGGKKGLFEEADGGSLFLDEIGELSAHMQAKLLRVLQEKEIVRVGGTKPVPVDVRIIAATHVHLEKAVAKGKFREDLYYRLDRMPIRIPPLRSRKQEIPLLCKRLIQKINQDYGRNVEGISEAALSVLCRYDWPGNVRELENVLGRAIIFMGFQEKIMDAVHLAGLGLTAGKRLEKNDNFVAGEGNLDRLMAAFEKHVVEKALAENAGNKTKAAKQLGISLRSLYYKLEKYNLAKNGMQ
ncbi:sigma-54-dependent Fis family transcriptional regulator [Weizmannia acidilactici]|uniref:sigma-54 interaction domain-containing protein n=1 Tax=Weizmannia acidilactici TaxID=2607726 RepID=UPI00124CE5BE|nr:sigma-54-dependent Fis family transcriptional regulator [Weizmannia acidilactici]GER66121.1 sigma-54-dependent Fis family transcriptional regulator [Weizmannia acidilactici]